MMLLLWVRTGPDILVGEYKGRVSTIGLDAPLINPVMLRYQDTVQQSAVDPRQRQLITQFKLLPISCGEIFLDRVDWHGEVKKNDAVYITYYKTMEAQKELEKSPLMIQQ